MLPITPALRPTPRSRSGSPQPARSSRSATSLRSRPSSCGSRRPEPDRRAEDAGRVTLRVIPGGRAEASAPGLLVVGASEVISMAGGLRMGAAQADVGRLTADDADGGNVAS